MIRLLRAGFQVLILGLNLMAIRYALLITSGGTIETSRKLAVSGSIITFVGFAIIVIGIIPWFLKRMRGERTIILSVGPSVTTLGIAMIIKAIGHGYENTLWIGAWIASAIGAALIFTYCGWYVVSSIKSSHKTTKMES